MKIDIITGFLGAGKTTFIAGYARYLRNQGEKTVIIENEFGLAGVDGILLRSDDQEVAEISGGCVCCSQRPKLIATLSQAAKKGYDRVIIEPSGIYNLDTFFELMTMEALQDICHLNTIITIVKPDFMNFSVGQYENIFMSQFLSTGAVVFSNTQSYSPAQVESALLQLAQYGGERNPEFSLDALSVYTKPWSEFTDEDYSALSQAGQTNCVHKRIMDCHGEIVDNIFFLAQLNSLDSIHQFVDYLLQNENFRIYRVKGHASDGQGNIYAVNCTHNCISIEPSNYEYALLNVLGHGLRQEIVDDKLKELCHHGGVLDRNTP